MPKLLIKRNSEWANRLRPFELYLNDRKFAEIKDRQVLSFNIPQGKYQLKAKVDWCGSPPYNFEIGEEDTKRIEIKGFILSKYLLPAGVIIALIYFGIYLKFGINSLFLATLMMIFLGYMLYFKSFGRNQYLRIREI